MSGSSRWVAGLAMGLAMLAGENAAGVEIESKAMKITLTGRQHTQFNTSSVEGEIGSEFLIRRARITGEVEVNDLVHGKVQPDFGEGKISLKDAYMRLDWSPSFQLYAGQFKRPFDLFELTSSTQILVIERAGKIRGLSLPSLSGLTEELGYSDRDIGVMASFRTPGRTLVLDAAVTNGQGANVVPSKLGASDSARIGEKQYTGRVQVVPVAGRDFTLAAGVSAMPVALSDATGPNSTELSVEYATAFEVAAEVGSFNQGLHLQSGAVFGDNWDLNRAERPTFVAVQGVLTYKHPLEGATRVTAIEPLVRVSWADPNRDADDDAGLLVTPGIQAFFTGRNKLAVNVDVFKPQKDGAGTEYSVKGQMFVHF